MARQIEHGQSFVFCFFFFLRGLFANGKQAIFDL